MEKIKKVLAKVFETETSKINNDFSKDDCDKWDSITHMDLIQSLETEFNIEFDLMETLDMVTLENIKEIIQSKL